MTRHSVIPTATLEFWFEFGSNYSYLAVMRIDAVAREFGVTLVWRPFLLGPIFKSLGWDNSPFVLQKAKGAYVWHDMVRQSEKYALPWTHPTQFPRRAILPTRVALLGAAEPWINDFCKEVMKVNFVKDRDIDTPEVVGNVLDALGLPSSDLIDRAQTDDNKRRLREQTEEARQRGIFGAPTFLVGSEMFWGNDRLMDALSFAAGHGAGPPTAS